MNTKHVDLLWDIKSLAYELYGASYADAECHRFAEQLARQVDNFLISKGFDHIAHVRGNNG